MDKELASIAESLKGIHQELQELKLLRQSIDNLNLTVSQALLQGEVEKAVPLKGVRKADLLRDFLAQKQIEIVSYDRSSDDPSDTDPLDSTSKHMGDHYLEISAFLERLKARMSTGEQVVMNLKDEPQLVMSSTCSLGNNLYKLALLSEYKYLRSPQYILKATPSPSPKAINFLNGGWLENYLRIKFMETLNQVGVPFSFMQGIKIRMPNMDNFELDFLGEIDGEIIWMEAKTGDYQRHIGRYSTFRHTLGIAQQNAYLVLADNKISSEHQDSLAQMFDMQVIKISQIAPTMAAVRGRKLNAH